MVGLGFLPGASDSIARSVSWDGKVVVGESGLEAFRFTRTSGMVGLGFLPGVTSSRAYDVSANGSVVVGESGPQAFRWTKATGMVGIGFLPGGTTSRALSVSADGSVVVGTGNSASSGFREAFIWDANHGMRSIQELLTDAGIVLTGWTLVSANSVSADGLTIVGHGSVPDAELAEWIARLDPPSDAVGGISHRPDSQNHTLR